MNQVRFNAFDKDSSASYSKSVNVTDVAELKSAWKEFSSEVPFTRWYADNEADENATSEIVTAVEELD